MVRWMWLLVLATSLCADVVVLVGPPGAGKGTLAERLAKERGWVHLSTGNMLRQEVREQSPLGKKIQEKIDAGHLVPDALMNEVLFAKLRSFQERTVLLDGYPRNADQASALEQRLGSRIKVIALEAPDQTLVERLAGRRCCVKCGASYHVQFKPSKKAGVCDVCEAPLSQRRDDTPQVVKERLALYHAVTEQILERYRTLGVLQAIDASPSPDRVYEAATEALR